MKNRRHKACFIRCTSALVLLGTAGAPPATAQMTPDRLIERMDSDGDGRISAAEFRQRRAPFSYFDKDGDGFATRAEIEEAMTRSRSRGGDRRRRSGETQNSDRNSREATNFLSGQVTRDRLDRETLCGIGRSRRCDIRLAIARGLMETGLQPRFPDGFQCRGIDETWAMSYTHKRDREAYHGGIDMPAPFGTPIIAAAAGTVIAKFSGDRSMRGIEIILRHSPDDTGIPLWIYTGYSHFDVMPALAVGQRVRMGAVLGPTGNSGKTNSDRKERRPAIHFAAWFSNSPDYVVGRQVVIPVNGRWMDPNALYRAKPPFDSPTMKALPEAEKHIPIPVMLEDGSTVPAGTKRVWPYKCARN